MGRMWRKRRRIILLRDEAGAAIVSNVAQSGSVVTIPINSTAPSGTVSSTITVPADAQFVIVGVSGYNAVNQGHAQMTFTKGGVDTVMTRVGGGDSNGSWNTVLFWLNGPDTGTNKSLKWVWTA
jgi:hypothetical protein